MDSLHSWGLLSLCYRLKWRTESVNLILEELLSTFYPSRLKKQFPNWKYFLGAVLDLKITQIDANLCEFTQSLRKELRSYIRYFVNQKQRVPEQFIKSPSMLIKVVSHFYGFNKRSLYSGKSLSGILEIPFSFNVNRITCRAHDEPEPDPDPEFWASFETQNRCQILSVQIFFIGKSFPALEPLKQFALLKRFSKFWSAKESPIESSNRELVYIERH